VDKSELPTEKLLQQKSSLKRRLIVNAGFNWVSFVVPLVIAFFLSPVLISNLGDERYGIWALVESVLAYFALLDLGIGASIVRFVAKFDTTDDTEEVNRVFNTTFALFFACGIIVLLGTSGIVYCWERPFNVPLELADDFKLLLILLGINIALRLSLGVFPAFLMGLSKYPTICVIRSGVSVASACTLYFFITRGGGLKELGIISVSFTILEHIMLAVCAKYSFPALQVRARYVNNNTFRSIRGYSVWAFLSMIAGRISFSTDSIVIAAFLAPQYITYFAIAARLTEYAKSSMRVITTVLTPATSSLETQGKKQYIRTIFLRGTRYILYAFLPVQCGLIILGKPFLTLWLGSEYAEMSYSVIVILAIPLGLAVSQSVTGRILYGIGQLRFFSMLVMTEAVLNVGLSLLLVRGMGIQGVAWGTAIPNVIMNIVLGCYICRVLQISVKHYVRSSFVLPVILVAIPAAIWCWGSLWLPVNTWSSFLAIGVAGIAVYVLCVGLCEFRPHIAACFAK